MADKLVFDGHVHAVETKRWFYPAMEHGEHLEDTIEESYNVEFLQGWDGRGVWLMPSNDGGWMLQTEHKALIEGWEPGTKLRITVEVVQE